MNKAVRKERADRFSLVWPIAAATCGVSANLIDHAANFSFVFELLWLLCFVIGIGIACLWLASMLGSAVKMRWRRLCSGLLAVPVTIAFWTVFGTERDLAAVMRLALGKADLDRQIAALPFPPGYRRARWDWGGTTTAVTGGVLNTLIFDETDRMPTDIQAGRGWPPDGTPWFSPDGADLRVESLGSHFYLVQDYIP